MRTKTNRFVWDLILCKHHADDRTCRHQADSSTRLSPPLHLRQGRCAPLQISSSHSVSQRCEGRGEAPTPAAHGASPRCMCAPVCAWSQVRGSRPGQEVKPPREKPQTVRPGRGACPSRRPPDLPPLPWRPLEGSGSGSGSGAGPGCPAAAPARQPREQRSEPPSRCGFEGDRAPQPPQPPRRPALQRLRPADAQVGLLLVSTRRRGLGSVGRARNKGCAGGRERPAARLARCASRTPRDFGSLPTRKISRSEL